VTTTQANDLIIVTPLFATVGHTQPTGYTQNAGGSTAVMFIEQSAYNVDVGAAGSKTVTWSSELSDFWSVGAAAFKAAGAGTPTTIRHRVVQ
jgi:hypothetical protein